MTEPSTATGARRGRRADLLSPEQLAGLGDLDFLARKLVEGFLLGLHRSPHRGFSAEFAELRGYQPGDDLRYIDWRMYARSDRFYVKQFEEETNLRAYLLLDGSGSMGWSSSPGRLPTKLWYGKLLAAALAHILLRQGDAVGLATFDERIRTHLPPRGGDRQQRELLTRLDGVEPQGETHPGDPLREIATRLTRRGMVVVISDLLTDPEPARRALQYLRHRGHQVLVLHLFDPGERDLDAGGREVRYYYPDPGEELDVVPGDMRQAYREAVDGAMNQWRRTLAPHGVDYQVVDTGAPFVGALRHALGKRARLG